MMLGLIAASAALVALVTANPTGLEDLPPTDRYDYVHLGREHVFRRSVNPEDEDARHQSEFNLPINVFSKKFNLHLRPNYDIFTNNATVKGKPINHDGFYKGKVMGRSSSFAHVFINQDGDISGTFWESHDTDHYHIRPTDEPGRHLIYTEDTSEADMGTCGADGPEIQEVQQSHRSRRSVSATPFTSANKVSVNGLETTICEMAVFGDKNFITEYGADKAVSILVERLVVAQEVMDNGADIANLDKYNTWGGSVGKVRVVLKIKWLDYYEGSESSTDAQTIQGYLDTTAGEPATTRTKTYLEQFSRFDWSNYCLAHSFTYINFEGTLGLAWTGYPKSDNHNGGICQARYNDGNKGYQMSLNSAWTSSLNAGSKQLEGQTALVFAHELGHNFGSPHDELTTVEPANGNYVMNKYAVPGTKSNHKKFSPASIDRIGVVMTDRAGCFVAVSDPVCGNSIVEEGEKCDCGSTDATLCTSRDACCKPGNCTGYKGNSATACSPKDPNTEGCCKDCDLTALIGQECGSETECKKAGVCSGDANAPCSAGASKPDNTFCSSGLSLTSSETSSDVCSSGSCGKSVCVMLGLTDCDTPMFGADKACQIYCKSNSGTCALLSTLGAEVTPVTAYSSDGTSKSYDSANVGDITQPGGASCYLNEGEELSGVCDVNDDNTVTCISAATEEDLLEELKRQYEAFKTNFLSWANQETAGVPRYVWLIIGGVILVILCCGGCYVANKDEVIDQKKKMGRRMSQRGKKVQG